MLEIFMFLKKSLFVFIFLLISLILIEIVSLLFLYTYSRIGIANNQNQYQVILNTIKSPFNHPVFNRNIQKDFLKEGVIAHETMSDPFLTYRLTPNAKRLNLEIDKHGIIHNGKETNFDIKYTKKIVMFGGSVVEGSTGSPNNTCTIPAFLEQYLNILYPNEKIQVINAGTGGSYSPRQLTQFNIEYVHYKPDLIISFDGYNDFWHAYPPSLDSGNWINSQLTIPNRSSIQLADLKSRTTNKLNFKDVVINYPYFTKFFWNTAYLGMLVVNKFTPEKKRLTYFDPKVNKDPWPHFAKFIMKNINKSDSLAPFFTNTWKSLQGSANAHGIKSLFFIQPAQPISNKKLTEIEQNNLLKFYSNRPHISRNDVKNKINIYYDEIKQIITSFEDDDYIDLTKIFDNVEETIYEDIIHYRHNGNTIIAKEMLPYIINELNLPSLTFDNFKLLECKF